LDKKQLQYYVGCLVDSAVGDALGATVEFNSYPVLVRKHDDELTGFVTGS